MARVYVISLTISHKYVQLTWRGERKRASIVVVLTRKGDTGRMLTDLYASQVLATVDIGAVPILEGAAECAGAGILSSLHSQNVQAQRDVVNAAAAAEHPLWPLLFDPQTGTHSCMGLCSVATPDCICRSRCRHVSCAYTNGVFYGLSCPLRFCLISFPYKLNVASYRWNSCAGNGSYYMFGLEGLT